MTSSRSARLAQPTLVVAGMSHWSVECASLNGRHYYFSCSVACTRSEQETSSRPALLESCGLNSANLTGTPPRGSCPEGTRKVAQAELATCWFVGEEARILAAGGLRSRTVLPTCHRGSANVDSVTKALLSVRKARAGSVVCFVLVRV